MRTSGPQYTRQLVYGVATRRIEMCKTTLSQPSRCVECVFRIVGFLVKSRRSLRVGCCAVVLTHGCQYSQLVMDESGNVVVDRDSLNVTAGRSTQSTALCVAEAGVEEKACCCCLFLTPSQIFWRRKVLMPVALQTLNLAMDTGDSHLARSCADHIRILCKLGESGTMD